MTTKDYNNIITSIEHAVRDIIVAEGDKTAALANLDTFNEDIENAIARGVSNGFKMLKLKSTGEEMTA